MIIDERFVAELKRSFPDRGAQIDLSKNPVICFPAAHPAVGAVQIEDNGVEVTVYIGKTHGHFSCYDETLSKPLRDEAIIKDVFEFLRSLFADEIVLFSNNWMGGWKPKTSALKIKPGWMGWRYYVWSGPYSG